MSAEDEAALLSRVDRHNIEAATLLRKLWRGPAGMQMQIDPACQRWLKRDARLRGETTGAVAELAEGDWDA